MNMLVLVISFLEPPTKTACRQYELYFEIVSYTVTYTRFRHCNKLIACAQQMRRQFIYDGDHMYV